ncbi:MAG: hypothetical protein K0R15_2048 [Clostridiales bacterium]|jgi:hypothetical protein|nr:hypothetical protein [Clostridiales bacterium]
MKDERWYFDPEDESKIIYYKLYLDAFSNEHYQRKLKNLINMNFDSMSNQAIRNEIRNLISFTNNITGQAYYFIPTFSYIYKCNSKFSRVRKLGNNLYEVHNRRLCKRDLWNPEVNYVKEYGRLNYPNESLLYTAEKYPEVSIKEAGVKGNDVFLLVTYEALDEISVTIAGLYQEKDYFTDEENIKISQLINGISDLLKLTIDESNKQLYRLTSNLIKECYYLEGYQDGWVYPSIALGKGHNVCFKPTIAEKKLKVYSAEICTLDEEHLFSVRYVLGDLENENTLKFHDLGSDFQKRYYPHLVIS